jgi:glycosyltransferase 2 family protein
MVAYFALSLGLFAFTTVLINPSDVGAVEVSVYRAVNGLDDLLFWPLWVPMQLGNLLAVPALAAAALMFRHLRLAAGLVLAGFSCWYLARVVKDAVGRGRPGALISDSISRQASLLGDGYVSGHATVAFALATVLHPYLTRTWRMVVWGLAASVGFARVYVGAHLPLDIVGGAALGCGVGLIVLLVIEPWRGDEIEEEDEDSLVTEI